ncbi:cation transporter HKT2;2-like [Curcuma longa]|uniref:cation transporter HKT2;2-like n=1 Tax=Curcuma longa TaxID=136217 RepID=UPI003D9EBC91
MAIFSSETHADGLIISRTYSFARLGRYLHTLLLFVYRLSGFYITPFFLQLCYFISLTFLGSLLLALLKPSDPDFSPGYLDMLFMSTSSITVSCLGVVEMERFSSAQIVVLMLLMFLGGDVFVSLLVLLLRKANTTENSSRSVEIEAGPIPHDDDAVVDRSEAGMDINPSAADVESKTYTCLLIYVISGYIATFHVLGTASLLAYFAGVSRARGVLKTKGINLFLFCLCTTVSSFANGGFVPTSENMVVFNRDPVVLLLMTAVALVGNTLFPLFLRLAIWASSKLTRRAEFGSMLKSSGNEARLWPLLPKSQTWMLSLTAVGLLLAVLVLFCAMDWNGAVFDGLNSFQKLTSALFIVVNSRHAGENSIDCSLISPAVLVFLIVMMYLPASASFTLAREDDSIHERTQRKPQGKSSWLQRLIFPQISWIFISVVAVCITERRKMSRDSLNFSTLNIIFEVTSGYGNVGLSTGYSCSRLQKLDPGASCEDKPYSLSGWFSDEGKLILILVMLYGRLKKFSAGCGKAWKLY